MLLQNAPQLLHKIDGSALAVVGFRAVANKHECAEEDAIMCRLKSMLGENTFVGGEECSERWVVRVVGAFADGVQKFDVYATSV